MKERSSRLDFFALAAFALLGAWLVRDYGITWDEPLHMERAQVYVDSWRAVARGVPLTVDGEWMRYGPLFNLLALPFIEWFSAPPYVANVQAYEVKHAVGFALSLTAYLALAKAFRVGLGCRRGLLLSLLLLATMPSFFAHAFFNPKDAPFAAVYTWASVALGLRLPRRGGSVRAAALTTLVASVRIGGLALLAAWIPLKRRPVPAAAVLVLTGAALVLIYPAAQRDPLGWLRDTIVFFNQGATFNLCRLVAGSCYARDDLRHLYLPVLFAAKTPLFHLAFGAAGIGLFLRNLRAHGPELRGVGLMLLAQLLILPLFAVVSGSLLYDADRHFLFMLPPLAFFAGYALLRLQARTTILAALALLPLGFVARDMVRLHPYEYAYYNELVRLGKIQRHWEVDYWGLSAKPLAAWLDLNVPGRHTVLATPLPLFALFAPPRFQLRSIEDPRVPVFLAAYYDRADNAAPHFTACPELYRETRQLGDEELVMGSIRACPGREAALRPAGPGEGAHK